MAGNISVYTKVLYKIYYKLKLLVLKAEFTT